MNYLSKSRLSSYYILALTESSAVFCGEARNHVFEGKKYARIAKQLAGNQLAAAEADSADEHQFEKCDDRFQTDAALEMAEKAVLIKGNLPDTPRTAYWESVGSWPSNSEIGIENLTPVCEDLLRHALLSAGIAIGSPNELLIISTDDYLRPEVMLHSERLKPSLIVKPIGHTIWLGPLIIPGKTSCFGCLSSALRRNRWLQEAARLDIRLGYLPQPSVASLPSTLAIATGMISTVVAVYLATGSYQSLENTIMTIDTRTMSCTYNPIQAGLDCPQCTTVALRAAAEAQDLHKFLSPITGIVSSVQVCDSRQFGFFHASGTFVNPSCPSRKRPPLRPGRSAGKGCSSHEAQVACIAEALERYSITYQGTELERKGPVNATELVPPNEVLLFSSNQFRNRVGWNSSHSELHSVPEPLPPFSEITWTEAQSFTSGRRKLVPAGLVYMHFPFTNEPEFCNADTNGCAAGRTMVEAKLNALLELIERDAVAIWWYNRIRRPAVDLGAFGDPAILEIQRAFQQQGHKSYVLDVTSDLGIPTYVAVAPSQDNSTPYFGCAAHVSPRIAALKALAEVSQVCFWSQQGAASEELTGWLSRTTAAENSYLEPEGITQPPFHEVLTIEDTLDLCIARVERAGIEPSYIDMTRPEIGVPVVRVIAPGLRHFWARFAPGRLYDVPVAMGWVPCKLEERDLNPVPCMI